MEQNPNALILAKNLLDSGIKDVRFYDDLCKHPIVQEMFQRQKLIENSQIAMLHPNQNPEIIQHNGYHVQAQKQMHLAGNMRMTPSLASPSPSSSSPSSSSTTATSSPYPPQLPLISPSFLSQFLRQATPTITNNDPNLLLHHVIRNQVQALLQNVAAQKMPTVCPQQLPQTSVTPTKNSAINRKKESTIAEEILECRRCSTGVNITRYSNLTNHVKRHCEQRMFTCTQCTFASNASSKVLIHMKQQHNLENIFPISKSQEELESIMDQLMIDCFPNYNEQLERVKQIHLMRIGRNGQSTPGRRRKIEENDGPPAPKIPKNLVKYHCAECRKSIQCVIGTELLSEGPLIDHLRNEHTLQCMPWKCGQCGYLNPVQWKVRRHIIVRHPTNACDVTVTQNKKPDWQLFLRKYFIDLGDNVPIDTEDLEVEQVDKHPELQKIIVSNTGKLLEAFGIPSKNKKNKMEFCECPANQKTSDKEL